MNTSPPNPFSGLKGALAGLVSGGWVGLVLRLLFWRRIAPMLTALETLFAQWQAGTLPVPAAVVRASAQAPAAAPRAVAPCARRRTGRRVPAARRAPVVQAAVLRAPVVAWDRSAALRGIGPALYALHPPRRRARSRKNADGGTRTRTPILFRYRN
jgi:hypothetical protein